MKRFPALQIAFLLLILACAPVTLSMPDTTRIETIVAATLQAIPEAVMTEGAGDPPSSVDGTRVSFENVSFVVPSAVASGANGERVDEVTLESGAPWDVAPSHIHFSFTGYNETLGKFGRAEVNVYPAQEYANANNGAAISLPKLQAVLASPNTAMDANNLPWVPYFNAAQMMAARVGVIPFASGSGVRMLTAYGQMAGPISNDGAFYHFEGLTSDGKYLVVVILPVGSPFLMNAGDPIDSAPPLGIPWPGYGDSVDFPAYESYFSSVANILNLSSAETFVPNFNALDTLVQSIQVTP